MSRWIDAEYAIEQLGAQMMFHAYMESDYASTDLEEWKQDARELLEEAPSIDIVRCKDCKWLCVITDEDEGTSYYMCGVWSNATDEDTFCSYGEVKR